MIITVGALAIGLVVGLARGGRIRNLTWVRLRWVGAGLVGLAIFASVRVGDHAAPELLLATATLLGASFALRNWRIVGLGVVGVGLLLNLAPLAANGYIPVDPGALVDAGLVAPGDLDRAQLRGGRALVDADTLLAPLGQRIPIPELGLVVSFGDLLIAVGLADALNTSLRRRRRTGGVPVAEILAADAREREQHAAQEREVIDLTTAERTTPARHEHPVEVGPGQPVPIPMGWGRPGDADPAAGRRPHAAHAASSTHVPWPWRRTPPPRPHRHPTMRAGRR